ncbi:MAG: type II restriction endonuclease [Chloroflexales bacterium]|nr:type II restriction endonuclease [Chloroflexales bacterium]
MTATTLYKNHLQSSSDLVTTYKARRAGFVALALEKNRKATPYVEEARVLYEAASKVRTPFDILNIEGIEAGLLAAAGLSDKSLNHLQREDKLEAINGLIKNFLEPAGDKFVEELVYRFLLTRGDTLGGSMRNIGGVLAQRKLSRAIISTLTIGGKQYQWLHSRTRRWAKMSDDDTGIELFLRGLNWENQHGIRTLIYNLNVPLVKNNVDLCLFNLDPEQLRLTKYSNPNTYVALGELKGGIDPAGADEHWKTARTALERIRVAFSGIDLRPHTFFIGAAIERKMADEIWLQLEAGELSNAANLNETIQVASISRWLCNL